MAFCATLTQYGGGRFMDRKQSVSADYKSLHIVKAMLSFFIWGLGQVFNRQFGKALFFFSFFVLLVSIELGTSNYFKKVDPYDKIIGREFSSNLAETFHQNYNYRVRSGAIQPLEEYEAYYEEVTKDGHFTNDELYYFIAQDMVKAGKDEKGRYILTPLASEFKLYMTNVYNKPGNQYNSEDITRLTIRLYMLTDEEFTRSFEKRYYNFFYDKAGFFIRGFWSIITLGETRTLTIEAHNDFANIVPSSLFLINEVPIPGHHSPHLLLKGLISTLIFAYFCIVWVWSVVDAYKTSNQIKREGKVPSQKEYFKSVYHNSFEYIVLFPALFVVTMISIMPIIFGFLIAFTSYSASNPINLSLFDWVGFRNFRNLFRLTSVDIPWSQTFIRVFTWTLVWAIFSTFTCYFAGFLQALILNNRHVVHRKLWRSILVLPWAVPAIISQMVFKIMFNDYGVVNAFLEWIGVYDILFDLGMLGRSATEVMRGTFWEKITFLGEKNIQWFTNPVNFTFTRAVLIIINIWLGFPFFMALITGVMTSIDRTLYEAAEIDGASNYHKFRYITLPMILSQTAPLLLMTFSGNFNNFGMIYFVTEGGYGAGDTARGFAGATDILISWMYSLTVNHELYNMASVFSILIFLIIGTISAWNFTRMRAFKED